MDNHLTTSKEYCGPFHRNVYKMSKELSDAVKSNNIVKALWCGVSVKEFETLKKSKPYSEDKGTKLLLSYSG